MSRARLVFARLLLLVLAPALAFTACEAVGWIAGVELLRETPAYQAAARMDRCHSASDAPGNCTWDRLRKKGDPYTVAFLGGSSVFGYPAGAPSFVPRVRKRLERAEPGRYHLVNFGLYCKDTLYVRACAEALIGPELDLLVIYAGHNDFANWMGAWPRVTMFVEENGFLLDLRDQLAGTHAYSMMAALMRKRGASFRDYARPPVEVFRATSRTILDTYAHNIADVLDRAAAADVSVLLVTLVSNLHEHPYKERDWDTALVAAAEPDRLADWRAPFADAVVAHRAGRASEALASFKQARDALPLGRAPSGINEIARALAAERDGVFLLDFERILEAEADGAPIGCSYFGDAGGEGKPWCDQFHPAPETHDLLAGALAERVPEIRQRSRPR